ncbi:MAG TPA: flavin-dependent oxidoreductase [Beijerinckiaceae bacterium]|jgi:2-polyprenyl-6-methoxyphenol hydroxylase-like FAD-dependent oxidoreductase
MHTVIIIGAGIGGLTLALTLHRAGIPAEVYEAAPEIRPVGVGINVLPHATKELAELGLEEALARVAVTTKEATFFNRFGQLIWAEPLGRYAGYDHPQFSIHRGDLQAVLLDAARDRIGAERIRTGWTCTGAEQDAEGVTVHFRDGSGKPLPSRRASVAIACDGIHSVVRKQFFPDEGPPRYSGVNMWRGTTRWMPFLAGANMVRAGWLATGKMVIYPIRNRVDAEGRQLVNWVAEIETPNFRQRDWNRPGSLDDFLPAFADWHFDWLDVPAFLKAADRVLEFPMVDQDPLPRWSHGRVTLLGDAAHPMVPRGSNGAGQAILDARALADCLAAIPDPASALKAYEDRRLEATAKIVLTNRTKPPDAILGEVFRRTGDRPFKRIEDVISREELAAMSEGYKRVAGYDRGGLKGVG